MGLGQVGAVVPGMMRVVVNQSHFLEYKEQDVSVEQHTLHSFLLLENDAWTPKIIKTH